MTTILYDDNLWDRLHAADLVVEDITNRDDRKRFADLGFWLCDPVRFRINLEVLSALDLWIYKNLGHKQYHKYRKRGPYKLLAVYINHNHKRFERVMAQLMLLGFTLDDYPPR